MDVMVLPSWFRQWFCVQENERVCLKGIELGGVHKIVLHNAKSALRGSDMVLCAFRLSPPLPALSILHFSSLLKKKGPSSEIMCLVCLSDNSFFAIAYVCVCGKQR